LFGYELTALLLEDGRKGLALSSIATELLNMQSKHATDLFKLKETQKLAGYGFGQTDKIIVNLESNPKSKVTFVHGDLLTHIIYS